MQVDQILFHLLMHILLVFLIGHVTLVVAQILMHFVLKQPEVLMLISIRLIVMLIRQIVTMN